MISLSFDPNVYGTYARFSATADFLELSALRNKNRVVREPDLARALDNGTIVVSPLGPRPADGSQAASIVFGILEERARILKSLYPFSVSRANGLTAQGGGVAGYRILLALTIAHAYAVGSVDPRKVFEGVVSRALQTLGLRSAVMGTSRARGAGGFFGVVASACDDVGLGVTAIPDVIVSCAAQDEKVDALAHLDLSDARPGRWTFIGQATIAQSDEWEKKAGEPKPKLWMKLINDTHEPLPFLAIPHHIEPNHLRHLNERGDIVILDRLRLARTGLKPTKDERAIVKAVDACKVDW